MRTTTTEPGPDRGGSARERFERLAGSNGADAGCARSVVALLRAEGRAGKALDDALADASLSGPQFNVLFALASAGGRMAQCTIAGQLLKSPQNVTALVDRLERDGLVRRVRSEQDRRTVFAEITESGWDAIELGAPALFDAERRILAELSASEREQLASLLDRVARAAQG